MKFKSGNWNHIKETGLKAKVDYTLADLELYKTGDCIKDAQTTIVVIWNGDCRYAGVAQCGPRDVYSKARGREIAVGRALKAFLQHVEQPETEEYDVWEYEGQEVTIYGYMPEDVDSKINHNVMFEYNEVPVV